MMSVGNSCNGRGTPSILLRGRLRLDGVSVGSGGNGNRSVHSSAGLNEEGLESIDSVSSNKFCENMILIVT